MTIKLCPITKCLECPKCQIASGKGLPMGSLACFNKEPKLIDRPEEIQDWCGLQDAS